jgi:2-keto-4-pentenoate hydratase/2-oxohepta-3-ene-1,7-dioic acid hydratase in catechol pathway
MKAVGEVEDECQCDSDDGGNEDESHPPTMAATRPETYAGCMRIARVAVPDSDVPCYALIEDGQVRLAGGDPFLTPTDRTVALSEVRLLAPVIPSKVVCIGKNYADHAKEMGGEVPAAPIIFIKPSTTVIGPGDQVIRPAQSTNVHHEVELAVVIGARCRNVSRDQADSVILGYTVANDVTARDLQASDGQWTRAKSFDTFCPLGPWIETEVDVASQEVVCTVNGQVRQSGSTADLVRGVAELVEFVSAVMTLLPGDVLLTGTPAGVGPLEAGDVVDCTVGGIGTLSNPVK